MAYTIQINEYQRQIIQQALATATADLTKLTPPTVDNIDGEDLQGELLLLTGMFTDLPAQAAASRPGTIHGFCL